MKVVLQARGLAKSYDEGPTEVHVLQDLSFDLYSGERVAIVGMSGSGKSTLLNLLGGLDVPSAGEVKIGGQDFSLLSANQRGKLRNQYLGFVYQFHHLLPEFSALENVAMPLMIAGQKLKHAKPAALAMLERVGLAARAAHRPAQLSGGERQRVAIARALINRPQCVLMDEPTGNLDRDNAAGIESLMAELKGETSFVLVTHDQQLASRMDRVLELRDHCLHEAAL